MSPRRGALGRARTVEYDLVQAKTDEEEQDKSKEEQAESLKKNEEQRTREIFIQRVQVGEGGKLQQISSRVL